MSFLNNRVQNIRMTANGDVRAWIVSADMGLGHQRATAPLRFMAEEKILTANSAAVTSPAEQKLWNRTRRAYETVSRIQQIPVIGKPVFALLDELQKIDPFYPRRDLSKPTYQVKLLDSLIRKGIGKALVEKLRTCNLPMITSFMLPAFAADAAGYDPVYCIICDAEISRAWVARDPATSRIRYLTPCGRARQRLKSYGVPNEGGEIALNLVAGIRDDVRLFFEQVKSDLLPNHPNLRILHHPDKESYFNLFAETLRTTDILWTKPSELSFYCGLGMPIIMAPPIGAQEHFNRKWLLEIQAGIPQKAPRHTHEWLFDLLNEGRLAEAAWDGFLKARKFGTYHILDLLKTGSIPNDPSPLKR